MSELEDALELLERKDLQDRCAGVERLAALKTAEATDALARLLEESSWYLRERVVDALETRAGVTPAVLRVLREGSWFARASACDVLGRTTDLAAAADLLKQVEDRNVSLQKSAVRALRRLAEAHGSVRLAEQVAGLRPESRRRVTARIGHQEPRWARELERALAGIPDSQFAPEEEGALPRPRRVIGGERALTRFRGWLTGLSRGDHGA